ncbi:MAG: TolC family protein [Trichodesmium sp. MAG_R03]|nr:TolC family protein [Trichodesmium sp. MAG_R03]
MSVFHNIVVVGVIGAVISNAGQGSSAPLPMHPQSNTPENSILDTEEVKRQSVEVKKTQRLKLDINSLEKVTQLRPQGSLQEKLTSNFSGTKVASKRNSEVNINKKLPESKPNKEIISTLKNFDNIYKNKSSSLAELKFPIKGENISPSELQFQQNINHSFAANNNKKFSIESKNVAALGKSNKILLELLNSKSINSDVEKKINSPVKTDFQQSTTFLNKKAEQINLESKNVASLGKSNRFLLELLKSKSENSEVETKRNSPVKTGVKQSITFLSKESKKINLESKKLAALGKPNSNLLDLLQSNQKIENSQVEIAKIQKSLSSSTPENQNQQNTTNNLNLKTRSHKNPILGNSYQVMTNINQAPAMVTINDLSEIETQASALNNLQKRNNNPIILPARTNQSLVSTIQRPPSFGNTSKQQNSVQVMTNINPNSTMNTVPNLARVENQKYLSNNSSLIIAQKNRESFPPPVPNGTLQTNPPSQIEPNSNPLYFPTTPDQVQIKETIPITLDQAIDLARRNSPEIQISQLEVERSRADLRAAQAALWPSLTFESTIQRTESANGDLRVNRDRRLARVTGNTTREITPNFFLTTFDNIFRFDYDFGLGKARSSRIGIAKEQMHLRELELERISETLRLDVSNNYYNLQQADGRVRIGEAAVRNARKSLEDAEALERAGVGTRFDVLQAQVTLSNEQQNLTNSLRDQRTAQRRLAEILSANELINLTAADPIEPVGSWLLSLDETIVAAFQNRAELEQQLVQRDLSDEQRKLALSSVRPNLNFFATYNVSGLVTEDKSWRAIRGWADGYTMGLRFRWNFFDGGAAKAAARQSILDGEIAETRFEELRNQIRREVEEAFFSLEASFENISTAELGVEQAKEALRLARLRFQAGVGTQLEVIQQETDLTRAENNFLTAVIGYNRSLSELQRAVSNLPNRNLSDNP